MGIGAGLAEARRCPEAPRARRGVAAPGGLYVFRSNRRFKTCFTVKMYAFLIGISMLAPIRERFASEWHTGPTRVSVWYHLSRHWHSTLIPHRPSSRRRCTLPSFSCMLLGEVWRRSPAPVCCTLCLHYATAGQGARTHRSVCLLRAQINVAYET